jgi:hypothetical protein
MSQGGLDQAVNTTLRRSLMGTDLEHLKSLSQSELNAIETIILADECDQIDPWHPSFHHPHEPTTCGLAKTAAM